MAKCCVLHSDGSGTAAPRYARPNVLTAATKATKCGTKPSRAAKDDRKWNGRPILGVNVLKQPYERPTQEPNHTESRLTNEIHDPFSDCKLPVATVAQSQSVVSPGVPSVAIPKTTGVIVIQTAKLGVTPEQVMAVMPAEIRATVNLYLDGKIRQWYSRGDGKGVVFLVEAKTEDEARAIMETLPLAKERLMDDQYVPVGPLMPLRALMGPGAQQ